MATSAESILSLVSTYLLDTQQFLVLGYTLLQIWNQVTSTDVCYIKNQNWGIFKNTHSFKNNKIITCQYK